MSLFILAMMIFILSIHSVELNCEGNDTPRYVTSRNDNSDSPYSFYEIIQDICAGHDSCFGKCWPVSTKEVNQQTKNNSVWKNIEDVFKVEREVEAYLRKKTKLLNNRMCDQEKSMAKVRRKLSKSKIESEEKIRSFAKDLDKYAVKQKEIIDDVQIQLNKSTRHLNILETSVMKNDHRLTDAETEAKQIHNQIHDQETSMTELSQELFEFKNESEKRKISFANDLDKYAATQKEMIDGVQMQVDNHTRNISILEASLIKNEHRLTDTETNMKQLKNRVDDENKSLSEVRQDLSEFKTESNAREVRLERNIDKYAASQQERLDDVHAQVKEYSRNIDAKIEAEHLQIMNTSEELLKFNNELSDKMNLAEIKSQTRIQEIEDAFTRRIESIEKSLMDKIEKQSEYIKHLEEALNRENKQREETMQSELEDVRRDFSTHLNKIQEELSERITHVEEDSKNLLQSTKSGLQQSLQEQKDKVNIILPNTFNKESVSLLGVMVVCWLFVLSFILVRVWRQSESRSTEPIERKDLQNNVLVIGYDDSLTAQYRALVVSACDEAIVNSVYVQQEEHITNMPAAKVCIMFVECSERHVIIETPGLGLGSLKRKTAEAVNKNGSCLVIVYARDLGSRSLRSQQRYNENIACVTSQPELSVLEAQGRFFSIYSELTDFQKKCLRNILDNQLNL